MVWCCCCCCRCCCCVFKELASRGAGGCQNEIPSKFTFTFFLSDCRFVYGVSDAASFSAVLGILVRSKNAKKCGRKKKEIMSLCGLHFQISMFPDRAATLMASCETFFGLGYTIGKLYNTKIVDTPSFRSKTFENYRNFFYLGPALGSFLYIAGGFQVKNDYQTFPLQNWCL